MSCIVLLIRIRCSQCLVPVIEHFDAARGVPLTVLSWCKDHHEAKLRDVGFRIGWYHTTHGVVRSDREVDAKLIITSEVWYTE